MASYSFSYFLTFLCSFSHVLRYLSRRWLLSTLPVAFLGMASTTSTPPARCLCCGRRAGEVVKEMSCVPVLYPFYTYSFLLSYTSFLIFTAPSIPFPTASNPTNSSLTPSTISHHTFLPFFLLNLTPLFLPSQYTPAT